MSHPGDVVETFRDLTPPPPDQQSRVFSAATYGLAEFRVAKSTDGRAALLVHSPRVTRAPIVTRHLRADFGVPCRVRESGTETDEIATIVECLSPDPDVVHYFLVTLSAALASLASPSSPSEVGSAVDCLIEVFRAMSRSPSTSVQGLWGELFLMSESTAPEFLIDQWHIGPNDRYDFASTSQCIEVKTAYGRHRRHRFSYEQLQVPAGEVLVVVSLQVESSAAGQTIADLVEKITSRIGTAHDRRLRLLTGVADALGVDWDQANRQRYDAAIARDSLCFFASASVPTIPGPIPGDVSDIRFTADLGANTPMGIIELRSAGGLFTAMIPAR